MDVNEIEEKKKGIVKKRRILILKALKKLDWVANTREIQMKIEDLNDGSEMKKHTIEVTAKTMELLNTDESENSLIIKVNDVDSVETLLDNN